jgi:hypothetical protein
MQQALNAATIQATLQIDRMQTLATVPEDFLGLSYESAQLANPVFFSAGNHALIALFRELGAQGVLRIGGGTSEFTAFTRDVLNTPVPFDTVGPDTSKNVKSDTPITPLSIKNLREFLDATGWRCLYGLNLGRGPLSRAAEEAECVQNTLGDRLIAFQLGNEPDAWRTRYRPDTWTYADYWKEWTTAHKTILARVPNARFSGPDISNKMPYVTGFAEDVKQSGAKIEMLTSHYYAMGPAGSPGMTIEKLLGPDPKLEREMKTILDAAHSIGVPYRMCEGNSCWNGGQDGVSDTFASALWVADVMLHFAALGCAGMNLHGGGNGFYTPIAGSLQQGFTRRPEFYGMLMMREFVGTKLMECTLQNTNSQVRAHAAERDGTVQILVSNPTEDALFLQTPLRHAHTQWTLSAPSLDAKQNVTLTQSKPHALHKGTLQIAPYSAVLVRG